MSSRHDERLSESHRKLIGSLEDTVHRQKHTIKDLELELYTREQRLVQLAAKLGFASIEEAEAAPPTAVSADRIRRYEANVQMLEAQNAELEKEKVDLLEKQRAEQERAYTAQAAEFEAVKRLNAEKSELREKLSALHRDYGLLCEQERQQKAEIDRLVALNHLHEKHLAGRSASGPSSPIVGKENLLPFPTTPTKAKSTPSTPTKRGSLYKHGSPSKRTATPKHSPKKSTVARLQADLRVLHARYEQLHRVHERAKACYAEKYKRWRELKRYLDKQTHEDRDMMRTMDATQRAQYRREQLDKRMARMIDILRVLNVEADGADDEAAPTPRARPRTPSQADGGEQVPEQRPRARPSSPPSRASGPVSPPTTDSTTPEAKPAGRKRTHRLEQQPPITRRGSDEIPKKKRKSDTQGSSDTEDDSQALPPSPLSRPDSLFNSAHRTFPTDAARASTAGSSRLPVPEQAVASRLDASLHKRRRPTYPLFSALAPTVKVEEAPAPINLLTTPIPVPMEGIKPSMYTPISLPRSKRSKEQFVQGSSRAPLPTMGVVLPAPGAMGPPVSPTVDTTPAGVMQAGALPTRTPSSLAKTTGDYSAYKGRGRYAQPQKPGAADTSINAAFEIDPALNAGAAFAFDEVVRNHAERRRLPAGDCEACRAYYEAVGPLPPRAHGPLWRSPTTSPEVAGGRIMPVCKHHGGPIPFDFAGSTAGTATDAVMDAARREKEIARRRGEVGRHRQQWNRAETPPGYWDIDIPDTQRVADINAQAEAMQNTKVARIAAEAERGAGPYRKRGENFGREW